MRVRDVAARVADDPRLSYLVVEAVVGVAVEPEARLVFLDKTFHV